MPKTHKLRTFNKISIVPKIPQVTFYSDKTVHRTINKMRQFFLGHWSFLGNEQTLK